MNGSNQFGNGSRLSYDEIMVDNIRMKKVID